MLDFDCDSITIQVECAIEPYICNSLFHPDIVARVSVSASKACFWVLGMLEAHKWRSGRGHDRLDRLEQDISDIHGSVLIKEMSFTAKLSNRKNRAARLVARGGIHGSNAVSALSCMGGGVGGSTGLYNSSSQTCINSQVASQLPPLKDWSSALATSSLQRAPKIISQSHLHFARTVAQVLRTPHLGLTPNQKVQSDSSGISVASRRSSRLRDLCFRRRSIFF